MRSVLIVDDNIDHADGLAMILEEEGYEVKVAYTGNEATAETDKKYYDIVLLDAKLPDRNGVLIYRELKERKKAGNVFMITGFRIEQLLADVPGVASVKIIRNGDNAAGLSQELSELPPGSITVVVSNNPAVPAEIVRALESGGKNVRLVEKREINGNDSPSHNIVLINTGDNVMEMMRLFLEIQEKENPAAVFFISRKNPGTEVLRSLEATGCMFKPFLPEDLFQVLESVSENSAEGVHHE